MLELRNDFPNICVWFIIVYEPNEISPLPHLYETRFIMCPPINSGSERTY